jgi:hypothetical protein
MEKESVELVLEAIFRFYETVGDAVFNFYLTNSRTVLDIIHIIFKNVFYILLYITILFTVSYALIGFFLMLKKNRRQERPVADRDLPTVTIQIPTYNELAALNCARRCLKFDYPKEKIQIIIGDDSSKAEISAEIDEFANQHSILVTRRGSNIGFKPGNLNHMLQHSKGEYLVIFDSDFLPEKDFLRRLMAPFVHDKWISAVQARWVTRNFSQTFVSVLGGTIPIFTHYLGLPFLNRIGGNGFIAGSAEAVRKDEIVKAGGWKSGSLTEDIEYSFRLTIAGRKTVYLEDLTCECEAPFTLKDLGKQQMRWAYGVVTEFKSHFRKILFNRKLSLADKMGPFMLMSGYMVTLLFFLLTVTGFLSIITHRPDLIDWLKFLSETLLNIFLTSGFLLTTAITLFLAKKSRYIPRMIAASFTVGLLLINIVSIGILKALLDRPMQWYMLNKIGNNRAIR